MTCNDVIRELSNYLDGDLDAPTMLKIKQHLADCKDCTLVVNQTKMAIDIFCDSEPVELPAEVRARLHEALRHKMHEARK